MIASGAARSARAMPVLLLAAVAASVMACSLLLGADPLAGTDWRVVAIDGMPPVAGSQPTIGFADGQASGSTGCNSFGGAYAIDGDRLTIEALAMTEMACQDPLGAQEAAIVAILGSELRFVLDGDRLELVGAAGALLLTRSANGA